MTQKTDSTLVITENKVDYAFTFKNPETAITQTEASNTEAPTLIPSQGMSLNSVLRYGVVVLKLLLLIRKKLCFML